MSPHPLSGAARLAGSSLLRLQSDDRLVALVRDGHDPAFSALVDRYRGELERYSARIVGESRAEDVVQQAFLNAHTAMTSTDSDITLRPWLYRIAHNAGLNVLRAGRSEAELDERLAAAGGVEADVESRERLREALAAISRLPEPQRDALALRALQGRSHVEIAAALGVSAGAARQHVHRARATVRAAVSAITPYGLIARFAMAGGGEPITAQVLAGAGAGASAGLSATVVKIGAGVLAAGAVATGTGTLPFVGRHHHPAPAAQGATRHAPAADVAEAAPAPAVVPVAQAAAAPALAAPRVPDRPTLVLGHPGERRLPRTPARAPRAPATTAPSTPGPARAPGPATAAPRTRATTTARAPARAPATIRLRRGPLRLHAHHQHAREAGIGILRRRRRPSRAPGWAARARAPAKSLSSGSESDSSGSDDRQPSDDGQPDD